MSSWHESATDKEVLEDAEALRAKAAHALILYLQACTMDEDEADILVDAVNVLESHAPKLPVARLASDPRRTG